MRLDVVVQTVLPLVQRIINNLPHSRLGVTPNSLVLPNIDLNKNMFDPNFKIDLAHLSVPSRSNKPKYDKHISKSLRHKNANDDKLTCSLINNNVKCTNLNLSNE